MTIKSTVSAASKGLCADRRGVKQRLTKRVATTLRQHALALTASALALLVGIPDELVDLIADARFQEQTRECCECVLGTSWQEPMFGSVINGSGQLTVIMAQAKVIASDFAWHVIAGFF